MGEVHRKDGTINRRVKMEKCTKCGKEITQPNYSPFIGICYDCYMKGADLKGAEVFYTKIPDGEPKIERIGEMKLTVKIPESKNVFEITANDRLAAYIEKSDPKKVIEFLLNAIR